MSDRDTIERLESENALAKGLLLQVLAMAGHNHWDATQQGGSGCELCTIQREVCSEIRAFLRPTKRGDSQQ